MPIQTTNPATNKIQTFEEMTDEQVDTATKSESTFQEWKTNHKDRATTSHCS
jgi:hypothetical protein